MGVVKMVIDKFGSEPVTINEDHPLAVAQREKDAGKKPPKPPAEPEEETGEEETEGRAPRRDRSRRR